MKIGLFGINFGVCADPDVMCRVARAAEDAGLESLWTGEHVVLPDPQAPPSPSPPDLPMLDPAVALAHVASVTRTIRLGTGIIILPQRNPLVLAKELASVDVVSRGRLLFGLGVGYLEPEFRAIGAPFEERGVYTDEAVAVMKALWTQWKPAHHGRFFSFQGIDAHPRRCRSRIRPSTWAASRVPVHAAPRVSGTAGTASSLIPTPRAVRSRGSRKRSPRDCVRATWAPWRSP